MRITKIIGVGCILSFVLLLWVGIKVLPQIISKTGAERIPVSNTSISVFDRQIFFGGGK